MIHALWKKLTGMHARRIEEENCYRATLFTRPEGAEYYDAPHLNLEITLKPKLRAGVEFHVGGEDSDFGGKVSLGWTVYFSIDKLLPWPAHKAIGDFMRKHVKHGGDSRSTRLEVYANEDGDELYLVADLWRDEHAQQWDDNKKAPWRGFGWHFMKDLKELVLGKTLYFESTDPEDTRTRLIWIQMPEGSYPAFMTTSRASWKRSLWAKLEARFPDLLKSAPLYRVNVKIPGGLAHEGKGENSYDIGTEHTDEISLAAMARPPHAHFVARQVADIVMRDRHRHSGGYSYVPAEGWPSCMVPHGQPRTLPEGFCLPAGVELEE